MRIGKYVSFEPYNNVKNGYGTIDSKNLKSIYLKLESWVEPQNEKDYNKILKVSRNKIKNIIKNYECSILKQQCIVDLDIKIGGIKLGKKSFMDLDITIFTKEIFNVKSKETKNIIKPLIHQIIDNGINDKNLFNFSQKKNN